MHEADATRRTLETLSASGIRIAIDDFGTGYSSLAYLKRFPLDVLKIDRSFVSELAVDPNDAAIVKTIIGLAENLHLDVVAEGVETKEQLEFLRANNCRFIQGYLIGRPAPGEDVPALIERIEREGVMAPA